MLHNEVASSSGVFYEAFCGDAAKYEAHLAMHEAAPRAMKQSLTASFAIFCKKMAERGRFELPGACTPAVFKTAALNHSTISPDQKTYNITFFIFFKSRLIQQLSFFR